MAAIKIIDAFAPGVLLAAARDEWPDASCPAWVKYDTLDQRKRTLGCRRLPGGLVVSDWPAIPPACRELLRWLLALDVASVLGLQHGRPVDRPVPDTLLWGAGLHEMGRGDYLGLHLDADRHPLTGMERRANALLFVHGEWDEEWGGALELNGEAIAPAPGRLVLFATDGESWHGVGTPLRCPPGVLRKVLAVYWWGVPRGEARRPQAEFAAPSILAPPSPEKLS